MRALLLCTIFGALSSAAHAAAPQCTLPNAGAIQLVDQQAQPAPPSAPPSQPARPQTPQPAASEAPARVPPSVAGLPFVQHVAAAGAVVSDLGSSHGMHSIAARNGDQFMIFQITPDGQAAVSGALTELTSAQLTTAAGGNVTPLAGQHGLDTLFVRSGAEFQVFYVAPDKERVIPGVLWDSAGKDLTRDQVANVPGAIPTVTVGDMPDSKLGSASAAGGAALPLIQKASLGTVGSASAPHLWMARSNRSQTPRTPPMRDSHATCGTRRSATNKPPGDRKRRRRSGRRPAHRPSRPAGHRAIPRPDRDPLGKSCVDEPAADPSPRWWRAVVLRGRIGVTPAASISRAGIL
jgi:hypothetical protein